MTKSIIWLLTLCVVSFFNSCRPKAPNISLSNNFQYVSNENEGVIRQVIIEQYDSINNLMGKKYLYKLDTSDGRHTIAIFGNNPGYKQNGDSLSLVKGSYYKLVVTTLGFKDTVGFRY